MSLRDDDPLLHRLIGTNDFSSKRSSGLSWSDEVISLTRGGVDIRSAERAVYLANRHPVFRGISPEEIIRRNL